ncbi:energy transducer TonB [Photobacterium kasasachensis]|uniref:energy transducer TonB n=1 Tax=Photobacterium kasasachensis TaxID=2910240 RepID=UPI003D127451
MRIIVLSLLFLLSGCEITPDQMYDYDKVHYSDVPKVINEESTGISAYKRVEPPYPKGALKNGFEGYVGLSFDIDETGKAINIKIIDSKPSYMFESVSLRALMEWDFSRLVVDGIPQEQRGKTIMFNFELE